MSNVKAMSILNPKSIRTALGVFTKASCTALSHLRFANCSTHAVSGNISQEKKKTADEDEIRNFSNLADKWWDEKGEFMALHSLNKLRVPFVRDGLINSGRVDLRTANSGKPLEGIKILDVGCGGGLMSEPLARLGAEVVGLDASEESIAAATLHAKKMVHSPKYICGTIEDHSDHHNQDYDAVVLSEVIEHIRNKDDCLQLCVHMLQPGGSVFITTFNRTWLSWMGIIASEYVLRIVPPNTHQYDKFISPLELQTLLNKYGCFARLKHGMTYNFLSNKWSWSCNTNINFALHAVKQKSEAL